VNETGKNWIELGKKEGSMEEDKKDRADKAEAELAELRAKLENAPVIEKKGTKLVGLSTAFFTLDEGRYAIVALGKKEV